MFYLVHIAVFWAVVILAIRLAVCFPRSLLARLFFARIGPTRARGEPEAAYLRQWAGCATNWFIQAAVLFFVGWLALTFDTALVDSLAFAVFWAVIVPLLGIGALMLALGALARSFWAQRLDRSKAASRSGT